MYFRGNDQDYVSSSSFEVSGIVYYENVTAAQTFTERGPSKLLRERRRSWFSRPPKNQP